MDAIRILFYLFVMTLPIAIVAFVYSYMLTRDQMILQKFYIWGDKNLPEKIYYPLIYCERCVSGQMGLWLGMFVVFPALHLPYNFFLHVYYIATCIFNVAMLKSLYIVITGEEKETVRDEKRVEDPPELKPVK